MATPGNGSEARKFPRICLVAALPNPSITHSLGKPRRLLFPRSAYNVHHSELTLSLLTGPFFSWFRAQTPFLISLRRRGAVFVSSPGIGVGSAAGFPRSRMYPPLVLPFSYEMNSADSRRLTSQRRYFYTMFTQASIHLRSPRGATILILCIRRDRQSGW